MEKSNIASKIITYRKSIEKIFIILLIISTICVPFVGINYDMTKYLPEDAPSKITLDKLEEEFGLSGSARLMVEGLSIYEYKGIKDQIELVEGVKSVTWIDDMTDIYRPEEFIELDGLENYYKDGDALMEISFSASDYDLSTRDALSEIEEIVGDKGYLVGPAVDNKVMNEAMAKETMTGGMVVVIAVAVILALTTTSWFEPLLFLMIIGISVIINMGTNIILGEVSFFTFSIAAILQLAVSMDYSIFLLHTFSDEKKKGLVPEEAIENAIKKASVSIVSSGATTIVGFLALTLMEFSIGRDMGIVLAKGIILSLISVLLLMPAFILRFDKVIEKYSHKAFVPPLGKLGTAIHKIKYVILVGVLLLAIPAAVAQSMNSFVYGEDVLSHDEGTKAYQDMQLINEKFGRNNPLLIMIPNESTMIKERELIVEIEQVETVNYVIGLAAQLPEDIPIEFLPESGIKELRSDQYSRIIISLNTISESELAYQTLDEIENIVSRYYDEYYMTGATPSVLDMKNSITSDYSRVNTLSMLGVAIVLVISFKSLIIPLLMLAPIQIAIYMNMSIPYLKGDPLIFMGYLIVSCVQLGATIDYAILLTNNYLQKRKSESKHVALKEAVSKSALSILTSGCILTVTGYGVALTSSLSATSDLCILIARGAILSMILVLGFLPGLLFSCDRLIVAEGNLKNRRSKRAIGGNKYESI